MTNRQATVTLSIQDRFSAPLAAYRQGMQTADQATAKLATGAKTASQSTAQFSQSLGQIAAGAGLYLGLAGITAAIIGIGKEAIGLGLKMEQTEIAFETLTGSAAEAQAHLEDLRAFAESTPFQFLDLVDASKRMHALGFETAQIIPMLTDIGDAVAALGGGSDLINRVTLALGQMHTKGKVSAQEMLQLTEAGIPAWQLLADAIGVTTAEVQEMTERGLIPAEQAIELILAGMERDFGGLMAQQADTAGGKISNLKDAWDELLTAMGRLAAPTLGGMAEDLTGGVEFLLDRKEAFEKLNEAMELGAISGADFARMFAMLMLQPNPAPVLNEVTEALRLYNIEAKIAAGEIAVWTPEVQALMGRTQALISPFERATEATRDWGDQFAELDQKARDAADWAEKLAASEAAVAEAVARARDAQAEAQASLDARVVGFYNLAEALRDTNAQELARTQLDDLQDLFERGVISQEAYRTATEGLGLAFGLFTPQSLALAQATEQLVKWYAEGRITAEDLTTATGNLQTAAADGKVDVEELGITVRDKVAPEFAHARDKAEEFEGAIRRLNGLTVDTYVNTYFNSIGGPTYGSEGYEHGNPFLLSGGDVADSVVTPPVVTPPVVTPPYTPPGPGHGEQPFAGGGGTAGGGAVVVNNTYNTTINDSLTGAIWREQVRREQVARAEALM